MKRLTPFQLLGINLIMTAVLFVIGAMILSSWQTKQDVIHGAASVEYVDSENCEQNEYTISQNDKQNEVILRLQDDLKAKVEIREFEAFTEIILDQLEYIRKRTDDIYDIRDK